MENLEPQTEVKIYTLSGKYITTLKESDFGGGEVVWNQENRIGGRVMPGLYVYFLVDGEGNKKTGRIVIR